MNTQIKTTKRKTKSQVPLLTYKVEVEKPRLVISYDQYASSPREDDNLGYFITVESKHISPDKKEDLRNVIINTSNRAVDGDEHIELIKKEYEDIIAIYPVYRYEHSGVSYHLGVSHGFDYSNCGFYIITKESQKKLGTPKKSFEKVITDELKQYNAWANGDVYSFRLYDEKGEDQDSCSGFYDIEEIRECLPKEFAKVELEKYFNSDY